MRGGASLVHGMQMRVQVRKIGMYLVTIAGPCVPPRRCGGVIRPWPPTAERLRILSSADRAAGSEGGVGNARWRVTRRGDRGCSGNQGTHDQQDHGYQEPKMLLPSWRGEPKHIGSWSSGSRRLRKSQSSNLG